MNTQAQNAAHTPGQRFTYRDFALGADTISGGLIALMCRDDKYRYHVWLNPDSLELANDDLHLNILDESKSRLPGGHKKLSASAKRNSRLIAEMKDAIGQYNLVLARKIKLDELAAKEAAENKAREDHARLIAAAPELLEALKTALTLAELGVAAHPDANGSGIARLRIIRHAIAKAVSPCFL